MCEKAAPYLWEVHKASGFTVSLRVLEGDKLVVLDRIDGSHPLKVVYPVGAHLSCNHGAAGKLLLAYQRSLQEIAALIQSGKIAALTQNTKDDVRSLEVSFKKISGYAITRGEALLGVIGVAVPVSTRDGSVKAVLALAAPESLCPAAPVKEFVAIMKDAADRLSFELGHRRKAAVG